MQSVTLILPGWLKTLPPPSQVWGGRGGTPSQVSGVPHPRSGGYPIPGLGGTLSQVWGYPIQTWFGGVPHNDLVQGGSRPGMGYPPARPGIGYPPSQTWDGVTPSQPDLGWGTAPPPRPDLGTPPWCGLTNKLKTVPSPILRMRAVKSHQCVITNKMTPVRLKYTRRFQVGKMSDDS